MPNTLLPDETFRNIVSVYNCKFDLPDTDTTLETIINQVTKTQVPLFLFYNGSRTTPLCQAFDGAMLTPTEIDQVSTLWTNLDLETDEVPVDITSNRPLPSSLTLDRVVIALLYTIHIQRDDPALRQRGAKALFRLVTQSLKTLVPAVMCVAARLDDPYVTIFLYLSPDLPADLQMVP